MTSLEQDVQKDSESVEKREKHLEERLKNGTKGETRIKKNGDGQEPQVTLGCR